MRILFHEKQSNRSIRQTKQRTKYTVAQKQIQESVAQKSFINNNAVEEKRTNIIMNNNNHNRTTSREYVINFLNEFHTIVNIIY